MLENKVAFITGGASGIGYACAEKFLKEGAKVVIADWNDEVESIAHKLGSVDQIIGLKVDVSKEDEVKNAIDKTVETFGKVDIAVANAGIGSNLICHEETMEEWNRVLGVNLTGVFLTDKFAITQMLKQGTGGSVINMASILGLIGSPNAFVYSTCKGGIVNMTRTEAVTYAKQNIRVNAIAPGYIDTPILAEATPEILEMIAAAHPVGRLGRSEEIANMACFLASDEASFVTGVTVPVDGGYVAQ